MHEQTEFFKVEDVMRILGCSKSKAYAVIRELNERLQAEGYMIRRGYISAKFFRKEYAL